MAQCQINCWSFLQQSTISHWCEPQAGGQAVPEPWESQLTTVCPENDIQWEEQAGAAAEWAVSFPCRNPEHTWILAWHFKTIVFTRPPHPCTKSLHSTAHRRTRVIGLLAQGMRSSAPEQAEFLQVLSLDNRHYWPQEAVHMVLESHSKTKVCKVLSNLRWTIKRLLSRMRWPSLVLQLTYLRSILGLGPKANLLNHLHINAHITSDFTQPRGITVLSAVRDQTIIEFLL